MEEEKLQDMIDGAKKLRDSLFLALRLMHKNGRFPEHRTFKELNSDLWDYMKIVSVMSQEDRFKLAYEDDK